MRTILNCRRCDSSQINEDIFISHNQFTYWCSDCGSKHCQHRPIDELDMLAETFGISRSNLSRINMFITHEYHDYASLLMTVRSIAVRLELQVKESNGYSPLTVQCHTCHSLWRYHRQDGSMIVPTYCIYCGSKSLTIHVDNDLDYLEVLASAYNLVPSMMKVLVDMFQHQNGFIHFNDYMEAIKTELSNV